MLPPVAVCEVPELLAPPDVDAAHCASSGNGSWVSNWFDRWLVTLPLASTSISWPAVSVAVVVPLTVTVPMKTQILLVPLGRTSTSNSVPRTSALTEWPPTLNVAPAMRCCTLLSVRPTFCVTDADCNVPSLLNCAAVTVTVVLDASRMNDPSGNWIAARPESPVRTELPAVSASPGMAVRYPESSRPTSTGVVYTTSAAGAGTLACACTTRKYQPPPTMSRTTTTKTPRQPRHPNPQPAQPLFLAGGRGVDACATGAGGGGRTAIGPGL